MNSELQPQERTDQRIAALFNTTGKRIRMLRIERGLSQLGLSRLLSRYGVTVNNTFISQIENSDGGNDSKRPPLPFVVATARVLGTSTDFLLMLTDDPAQRSAEDPHD